MTTSQALFNEIFFQKLAAHGYVPEDEHQAAWLLDVAGQLKEAGDELALSDPDGELTAAWGGLSKQASVVDEAAQRNLANALAEVPEVYHGILLEKLAEVSDLEEALEQQLALELAGG